MTAQIPDSVMFESHEFLLIGVSGSDLDSLLSPEQFGMQPIMIHTACYRGFYCSLDLTEEGLFLREVTLREENGNYLQIQGAEPKFDDRDGTAVYRGLNIFIPFTGKIRIAKDFISELYIHMGFQKASSFEVVYDVTLRDGKLVELKDRSAKMKEKRGKFKERYEAGEPIEMIEEAFDRFSTRHDSTKGQGGGHGKGN